MKTFYTILAFIAIIAVCYYLMCYVNVILGFIAIGLGINTLDRMTANKGAE